jgi:hypothetical protein
MSETNVSYFGDVDIDFPTKFKPLNLFPNWIPASIVQNEKLRPHPCGIYPQNIPIDPLTKLAAIPYEEADEYGYFKLDFLHLSVYDKFESREEIEELLTIEPDWNLFLIPSNWSKLFQMSRHGELLQRLRPRSIEDVADAIALIRPGKIELLPLYLNDKAKGRAALYKQDASGFSFKKSHAIGYALVIVLQLHLLSLELL